MGGLCSTDAKNQTIDITENYNKPKKKPITQGISSHYKNIHTEPAAEEEQKTQIESSNIKLTTHNRSLTFQFNNAYGLDSNLESMSVINKTFSSDKYRAKKVSAFEKNTNYILEMAEEAINLYFKNEKIISSKTDKDTAKLYLENVQNAHKHLYKNIQKYKAHQISEAVAVNNIKSLYESVFDNSGKLKTLLLLGKDARTNHHVLDLLFSKEAKIDLKQNKSFEFNLEKLEELNEPKISKSVVVKNKF